MTIIENRLVELEGLTLDTGAHDSWEDGACVMEAVAYVAGEEWSDHPECASPVIATFLRSWNDNTDDEGREALKPYIPRLVGTAASREIEDKRAWMAADWMVHVHLPLWLRAAGMEDQAVRCERLPEITDRKSWQGTRSVIRSVRDLTWDRRKEWRAKLTEAVKAELSKRAAALADADADADAVAAAVAPAVALAVADADADADADAVAAAVAVALAVADAAADADAVAVALAVADAVADADAVAAADTDAVAAALADADADADAVAAAVAVALAVAADRRWNAVYWAVRRAIYDTLKAKYRELIEQRHPGLPQSAKASALELVERMIAVTG